MSCNYFGGIDTLRVTRLDPCGRPICAADSSFVTTCLAAVNFSANTEDGTQITYRNGRGEICAQLQRCNTFTNFSVSMEVLFASPEMLDIVTNAPVVFDYAGRPVGWEDGNISCRPFALEFWAQVLGSDCDPNEAGQWFYGLVPWVTGATLGDLEMGSEALNFTMEGFSRAAGNGWGRGPYDVVAQSAANDPGPLLAPLTSTSHRSIQITGIAPPEPSCDYQPVTGCTSPSPS